MLGGAPATSFAAVDTGAVEYLHTRHGEPVTVYAHGLLGSITETRPFASGISGTAVFMHFRGHGRTRATGGEWDYRTLAGELRAVADQTAATRALGVSLGVGATLRLLAGDPGRFERMVLMLPATIDESRGGAAGAVWQTLADRVEAADAAGVARSLLAAQPPAVRELPEARQYYERVATAVAGSADASAALRAFPRAVPLADRAVLRRVEAPVLVVCQPDDPLHPVDVGADLAELLPAGRLHVLGEPGALWLDRAELRAVLTEFLS